MTKVSELYLACYQPSSFYITSKSTQGEWLVNRVGNKYVVLNSVGNLTPPWMPRTKTGKFPRITIKEVVKMLQDSDIVLKDTTGRQSLSDFDLLHTILSRSNLDFYELSDKLEFDLKEISTKAAKDFKISHAVDIHGEFSKGSKKYGKVQELNLSFTTYAPTGAPSSIFYSIEVVPFEQNAVQLTFKTYVWSEDNPNLQADLHRWLKSEITARGYLIV